MSPLGMSKQLVRTAVTVRAPATTANLGPAFDVLGMAMDLWMTVRVESASRFEMHVSGEGAADVATDEGNLIVACCYRALELAGFTKTNMPRLKFTVTSDVPFGCGCGSSSAAAIAGVLAGLSLSGHTMPVTGSETLLQLIAELEGHPDNAAPAIYGGVQLGIHTAGRFSSHRVSTPSYIWCVLFVPKNKMKQNTHATRKLVPSEVSMKDAVHNMGRTALITLAFATDKPELLRECTDDRFHQPGRSSIFPHLNATIEAAMRAGAAYAFLSGAGPTVCALVWGRRGDTVTMQRSERRCDDVAAGMLEAATRCGVPGAIRITRPTDDGAHVVTNGKI
mgnify:FL=1